MGGAPKGLLRAPRDPGGGAHADETLLARLVRVSREAGLDPILVGRAEAYAAEVPGVPRVPDDTACDGPLAGLLAALAFADAADASPLVLLACDMPFVTADDLRALAADPRDAEVFAATRGELVEPFPSRFDARRALPLARAAVAEGARGFQALFARVRPAPANELPARAFADWDAPSDLPRERR